MWLTACGGGSDTAAVNTPPPPVTGTPDPVVPVVPVLPVTPLVACTGLAGLTIAASDIGLPTGGATVVSAKVIASTDTGNTLGDYCQVRGAIAPVDPAAPAINFAVNLPLNWNRKAIQFGSGGFGGVLIDGTETIRFGPADKPAPLKLGYATYGDDSGHQASSITDGRFATNDEALANYGGNTLKKTRDVAQVLMRATYGMAPSKAYFLGTSTGGRDALSYIQRWPLDYDGVIANEPALNYTGTRLSNVAVGRALYANGGAGWLNVTKTLLVQRTVLASCDRLDGAVDGIISNVESCRQLNTQILASLRCANGLDQGNSCLSDAQLATVRTIESPLDFSAYSLANGVRRAGGYNLLEGTLVAGPFTSRDLGTRPVPANPATSADANMYVTGDQWVKYFVTRQASFDTLGFDPLDPGAFTSRVAAVSALTDATNADLRPFLAHGGRLILLHGLADEVISGNSTIDYFQRVITTVGQGAVDAGVRFYTVPGMGHGTGVFIPNWDSLAALENWVEGGLAPATGIASDAVAATYGRTRPLCQFPAWPKYRGSGSLDAAVNYSCVQEAGDPLACANLPASVTTYRGGNVFGEELRVTLDPASLAYTITVDASLQRTAGTTRSGTLLPHGNCSYASAENGALFTLGAGGLMQGGVAAPTGSAAVPLLAFQTTVQNLASTTSGFSSVANISNVVGVQYGAGGGVASPFAASTRVRNAGTFQQCRDAVTGRFMTYDATCTSTARGYFSYNSGRGSYDVLSTATTVTTGGTPAGSAVFGQVGANIVTLVMVRESATSYGLRLFAPQTSLTPGAADGHYAALDNTGTSADATVSGSSLALGSATGSVTYDSPVPGVAQTTVAPAASVIYNAGLIAAVPDTPTAPVFTFAVRN